MKGVVGGVVGGVDIGPIGAVMLTGSAGGKESKYYGRMYAGGMRNHVSMHDLRAVP